MMTITISTDKNNAELEYAQELVKGLKKFAERAACGGEVELWLRNDDDLNEMIFYGGDVNILPKNVKFEKAK